MFLENKSRKQKTFQVPLKGDEPLDQEAYSEMISNPLINIIESKWVKKREEKWDGFGSDKSGTVEDLWFIVVDYEERSV